MAGGQFGYSTEIIPTEPEQRMQPEFIDAAAQFATHGFAVVRNFLGQQEMIRLLSEVDAYEQRVLPQLPAHAAFFSDPDDMPPLTTELSRLIRDASEDENIIGIRFEVTPTSIGWGQVQEIRGAISDFVASGKGAWWGLRWGARWGAAGTRRRGSAGREGTPAPTSRPPSVRKSEADTK